MRLHHLVRLVAAFRPRMLALALVVSTGAISEARAVAVSPAALYLDARTRSGMLTLHNPGTLPEEIEIGFAFGYPTTDSTGMVSVHLVDVAPNGEPSLVPYLRAFPRRLRLEPGQRQVVRVLVNPPADLAPGEYWGRITILSRGGQAPVEARQGDVTMQIQLQTQVVAAITYRNGDVSTGVAVPAATAQIDTGAIRVAMDLARQGNAAFLGRVQLALLSPGGQVLSEYREDIAVYRTMRRVLELPLPDRVRDLTGHRIRFTVSSERPDLPDGGALLAPTVTGTIPLP